MHYSLFIASKKTKTKQKIVKCCRTLIRNKDLQTTLSGQPTECSE